jgi:hypothetical protein
LCLETKSSHFLDSKGIPLLTADFSVEDTSRLLVFPLRVVGIPKAALKFDEPTTRHGIPRTPLRADNSLCPMHSATKTQEFLNGDVAARVPQGSSVYEGTMSFMK